MSEDRTQQLPGAPSFEERVLTLFDRVFAELATIRADIGVLSERQDRLEDKVDRRLQETRPIWEAVLSEVRALNARVEIVEADMTTIKTDVQTIKEDVKRVDTKFEVITQQLFENATDIKELRKRVTRLEDTKPS